MNDISQQDFALLRDYIRSECALEIGDDKKYLVESRLSHLITESGCRNYNEFYKKAKNDRTLGLRDRIVDAITTHETLWFRDKGPWKIFENVIMPAFVARLKEGRVHQINIWSAACSTGQEAYSTAILIDEWLARNPVSGIAPDNFRIIGSDVSPAAIETAREGVYSELEMSRGLSPEITAKYFKKEGNAYRISSDCRRRVDFRVFNLQDNFMGLRRMDLVLCRYVMIYFSKEFKEQLMRRFAVNMNPGGYFITGSTEANYGRPDTFEMKEYDGSVYYQLKKF